VTISQKSDDKLAVIGVGRVGALTAVGLAHLGHDVVGTDLSAPRISALARGYLPEQEAGLRSALTAATRFRRLHFASSLEPGAFSMAFLCVDTPSLSSGEADLRQIFAAAQDAADALAPEGILATRSTIPVGTGDRLACVLRGVGRPDVEVVHVPEFLREGHAWEAFLECDRLVIGGELTQAIARVEAVFRPLGRPTITTDRRTAELAKYAANAFLATSISFANEMAGLANTLGVDPSSMFSILRADRRIGPYAYLTPGLGFGGHCLPKDTAALEQIASAHGQALGQLRATLQVNQARTYDVAAWLRTALGGLRGKRICIAGLTFKPGSDDLRQSPPLYLAMVLRQEGACVTGWDETVSQSLEFIETRASLDDAATDADAIVLSHECHDWREIEPERLRRRMRAPVLYDAPGALSVRRWTEAGFLMNRSTRSRFADAAATGRSD